MGGVSGAVGGGVSANPRSSLRVMLAVWRALFLREALVRLSSGRAAWAWLIVEPVAHTALLMAVFTVGLRERSVAGVEFALFLALGILGYQFFKNPAQRALGAIEANSASFAYRQVRPFDPVAVRCFLEGFLQMTVVVALLAGARMFGFDVLPHDPLLLMTAFLCLWLLGCGIGLMLSVGGRLVPEIAKVAGLIFTPLYFCSGIFFRPEMAPPFFREILLMNPILHGIETLRMAMFPQYAATPEIDLTFLAKTALVTIFIGLALHVRFAQRLAAR